MDVLGIVAFAFGTPSLTRSNQRVAEIASRKSRELNAPVYTQLDVRVESGVEVTYTDEEQNNPPPTLRIARGAVGWAKQHGLRELWIVAAKPHLWRVLRDMKQAIREAGVKIDVRVCDEIERYAEDSWFSPDSEQIRVRSRGTWNRRERVLKLIPFSLYKHIAK